MGKRYYWLKLPDDFFRQKPIKKLRKIAGGDTYTIIYLKMLLISLKNEGKLFFDGVEENFTEEIALELDEEEENVKVTVQFLMAQGLLQLIDESEYELTECSRMVGSESASAERMRRLRDKKTSQCDIGVTQQLHLSDVEKEKEIEIDKDKEIENRERVRDNGSTAVDAGLSEIIRSFEDNIGSFPPAASDALMGWRELFTDDLILLAIKKAALAGVRKWSYVNGILKVWKNEGVRTLGDVQSRDERRKPPAGQQPKRSAAEDYNEIFGELLGGSTT